MKRSLFYQWRQPRFVGKAAEHNCSTGYLLVKLSPIAFFLGYVMKLHG
ncbi:MAG: hypothetical protein VKL59_05790 [Nostocaceae cyanobacterium]|nr:hypothetical protein [Nostocaceae cyanobacterium]